MGLTAVVIASCSSSLHAVQRGALQASCVPQQLMALCMRSPSCGPELLPKIMAHSRLQQELETANADLQASRISMEGLEGRLAHETRRTDQVRQGQAGWPDSQQCPTRSLGVCTAWLVSPVLPLLASASGRGN